jgi:hypothetical protein
VVTVKNIIDKYFEAMNDLAFSEFQANILMAELDRLANQKTELRNLIYINKESLREDPKICINKCGADGAYWDDFMATNF